MKTRTEAEDILHGVGISEDTEVDLAEAALALAALDRPGVALQRYRDHVARLTDDIGAEMAQRNGLLSALHAVIAVEHGYTGDTRTYDDIQNANLMRVVDRKKGLPVALGILYLHAARVHGYAAVGLNFPGHFLIRLVDSGAHHIIDPFNGGIERFASDLRDLLKATAGLDAELNPEFYQPIDNRDVLIRLQNNIKERHMRAGRTKAAIRVLEGMLLFAPDRMILWRETGVLNAQVGHLDAAMSAFRTIEERSSSDAARQEAASIIQQLKFRLN